MKTNYKSKRIEVEGRIFELEFWEEPWSRITLHYVCVSEIILTEVKKSFWLFSKTKTHEYKREIAKTWGVTNRIEWAMNEIGNYLRLEQERMKDRQDVEDFCNREN